MNISANISKADEKLLFKLQKERGIKKGTIYNYRSAIILYTNIQGQTMSQLIKEAEKEEDKGIRWKHRKIKSRLIEYRAYLYQNISLRTAKSYLSTIKTIYRHFEIEIHELPQISERNVKKYPPLLYDDIITKKEIQKTLEISDPKMRAIILFMCSSGCAMTETHNLTIQNFIDAVSEYTTQNNIYKIIEELEDRNDIVPTWKLRRQKTNHYFYTFSSPESTKATLAYLKQRKDTLNTTTQLFKFDKKYLAYRFNYIDNVILKFNGAGGHRKFRTHMLRKFHASNLAKGENPLTFEEIDTIQGRKKRGSRESYFFDDPNHLKQKYIDNLEQVTIGQEIDKLTIDSPEVLKIKKEKKLLENENKNYRNLMDTNRKKLEILERLDLEDMKSLLD